MTKIDLNMRLYAIRTTFLPLRAQTGEIYEPYAQVIVPDHKSTDTRPLLETIRQTKKSP
jgi:hypothetical protein